MGFNSFYLVFNNPNIIKLNNNDIVIINVNYINYIPTVCFYKNNITYPNILSNKYYLMTKYSNNEINTFNINNDYITIDNTYFSYTQNKINLLTINYLNTSTIVPPNLPFRLEAGNEYYKINNGVYLYAISYYTLEGESDIGNIQSIETLDQYVKIKDISISENNFVIGRKIYRTKANETTFYLLAIIKNNTDTSYIDNIMDKDLGINYNIENNIVHEKNINNLLNNSIFIIINIELFYF